MRHRFTSAFLDRLLFTVNSMTGNWCVNCPSIFFKFTANECIVNKEVLDNASLQRALTRITYEIIERNKGGQDLVLVGIKTRGEFLAHRIANRLEQLEGVKIPVMAIDITNFRDDVLNRDDSLGLNAEEKTNISDKNIVLIDDVLFTGRTIRAALDALIHIGRPNTIALAVLVERSLAYG